jgi:hypothetical protein
LKDEKTNVKGWWWDVDEKKLDEKGQTKINHGDEATKGLF